MSAVLLQLTGVQTDTSDLGSNLTLPLLHFFPVFPKPLCTFNCQLMTNVLNLSSSNVTLLCPLLGEKRQKSLTDTNFSDKILYNFSKLFYTTVKKNTKTLKNDLWKMESENSNILILTAHCKAYLPY